MSTKTPASDHISPPPTPRCRRRTPFPFGIPPRPGLPASHALFLPRGCGGDDFCVFLGSPEMLPLPPFAQLSGDAGYRAVLWEFRVQPLVLGLRASSCLLFQHPSPPAVPAWAAAMLFAPTLVPRDNLRHPLSKSWPNPVPVEDARALPPCGLDHRSLCRWRSVTWGGGSPLPGQNLGGTESPNMPPLPPLPCRAGSRRARGRRAAAFPTLHNFHFNGFSSFFFLCCMSASIFHS